MEKIQKLIKNQKIKRLKPVEFLKTMDRIAAIDEAVKEETEIYEQKMLKLRLEREYLWNQVEPAPVMPTQMKAGAVA